MQGLQSHPHKFISLARQFGLISPVDNVYILPNVALHVCSLSKWFQAVMSCNKINMSTKLPELHDWSLSGLLQKEQLHWPRMVAFLLTSSSQTSPAFVKAEAVPCKSTKSNPTVINWVKLCIYVHQEWRHKPDIGQSWFRSCLQSMSLWIPLVTPKHTCTTSDPLLTWWVASGKSKSFWDRTIKTIPASQRLSQPCKRSHKCIIIVKKLRWQDPRKYDHDIHTELFLGWWIIT